ncbi:uncharacterized protein F4822DRAFT_396304 [Hypoxylon trugodes]|uniref:uncharacterized protein n=1 Tax=Hypoxylon trugodes TaxID=326681 RepID=UPI00219269D7|nr:uncharacterized protein F4822DRAFT_396304 [Hypoxylon trugodes]KAI1391305.1 hypothetical protein F4822DRAFT_396304 [Hypoxylon trugodes]
MADLLVLRGAEALRRVSFRNDIQRFPIRTLAEMADSGIHPVSAQPARSEGIQTDDETALTPDDTTIPSLTSSPLQQAVVDPHKLDDVSKSPRISRNPSFSGSSSYHEDWDSYPPLDRLTVLDLLDNFALPQQLEKLQKGISAQTEKVRKSRAALKTRGQEARERMVEEWRRRVPSADEQLVRYRKRMRQSVDRLSRQWNDTKVITLREKVSFIAGVMNIFISGYLLGAYPQYFHLWYTAQLIYFMPIRFYTYRRRGYHYFLADLCYFVNLLLFLTLWVFPSSKRLFIAAYCLAFGNNAVAIIMWRNSLVFHDFDKVTSLFIHIMPCATLHAITHLFPSDEQRERFPALWAVKNSPPGSPAAYGNLISMLAWSTIPYIFWQLSYYFFITVRRREKIAAGRPTSFTWLRRSYSKTWIGKFVLSLPLSLQEPAFMMIQYLYAVLTMLPCPLWFYSRWASSIFMMVVFVWSVYNGSTYYIDVFGKRFQKELEAMKAEVAKWQNSPDVLGSPTMTPMPIPDSEGKAGITDTEEGVEKAVKVQDPASGRRLSVDEIPLLNEEKPGKGAEPSTKDAVATGIDERIEDLPQARKYTGAV